MMCYGDKFLNLFLLKSALVILLGVGDIKCYYIIHKADILQITNNILFLLGNLKKIATAVTSVCCL